MPSEPTPKRQTPTAENMSLLAARIEHDRDAAQLDEIEADLDTLSRRPDVAPE